ncbi:hypothetical protein J4G02_07200 [Candidatus Poribacteria bacterium]|nr:hypothetical protein [Candidatus Poribacteria bacterium]
MSRKKIKSWRVSQVTSAVWTSRFVFTVNRATATAKLYLCLLILLSSIFVGCIDIDNTVQSLNPFYTDEAVVEFPQLEGEWLSFIVLDGDVSPMNIKPWVFENNTIKIFDENRKVSIARIKFFQIEDSYFADIVMANFNLDLFDDSNDDMISSNVNLLTNTTFTLWSMSHWRPVHIVYKVQIDEDNTSLLLTPLSFDWLAKILEENPDLIPLIEQSDTDSPFADSSLANATSETWMSFLEKYRHEEKAFPSDQMFKVLLKKYGKSHVLQSYENGNPQVSVFPEDREFPDGTQARANTPILYTANGQVTGLMLSRDWQAPAGFWLKAGTWVEYFENGHLKHVTLAQDWESPKGKLIKAGTFLEFSKGGKIKKASSK